MYAVRCMESVFTRKTKISLCQMPLMLETEFKALDGKTKNTIMYKSKIFWQKVFSNGQKKKCRHDEKLLRDREKENERTAKKNRHVRFKS